MYYFAIYIILMVVHAIEGQENADTNVAASLVECYNNTEMATREYRLPATMSVLIELIRRAEETNVADARLLSVQLLHRFRQDGIWKSAKDEPTEFGLPYSPKRWENYKFKLQLTKFTPGNAITFANNSLTRLQRCSLHYMLSSTIEINSRGDEATVCSQISRYTLRNKREIELTERVGDPAPFERSDCPIESGVVQTKWGAVKAGLLISGIAAGLNDQPIQTENGTLDNKYASTIAGELSEAALYQATTNIKIGIKGGWNSTAVPKYYFLQEKDKLHVTDAEIRGGLDGLYLALHVSSWKSKVNYIKISQILDLYYSSRGVFDNYIKACNRQVLETNETSTIKLITETQKFNYLLNSVSTTNLSPYKERFYSLSQVAVNSFNNYLTNLNDVQCANSDEVIERVATDIVIFLDIAWPYRIIEAYLGYILENIDVNKYESTYTIINGANSEIIVNRSTSILDFYEVYNRTQHDTLTSGFDYKKIIATMETIFQSKLNNETQVAEGQSTIALLMPHHTPTPEEKTFARNRKEDSIRHRLPDLKVLIFGVGSKEDYTDFVTTSANDVFIIQDNNIVDDVLLNGKAIIERIKQIPRNIINPSCGSSLYSVDTYNFALVQYVEPTGKNYHKISANYFATGSSDTSRKLKVIGQGFGSLMVCMSRKEANPTNTSENCKNISSDEISYDITSYCGDSSVESCSPIYLTVVGLKSNTRCNEPRCRFPDNIKYTITLENVSCTSDGTSLLINFILIVSMLYGIVQI